MPKKEQQIAVVDEDEKKVIDTKKEEAAEILREFKDFQIDTDEDYEVVAEGLKEVKRIIKEIESRRKLVTDPLNKALAEFRSWYKPALDILVPTEDFLKKKLLKYTAEKEEKSQQAMLLVAAAAKDGNFDAAHEASKQISAAPAVVGISQSYYWDYEVVSHLEVPRAFLAVNDTAVREYIKQAGPGGPQEVPGLQFIRKTRMAART